MHLINFPPDLRHTLQPLDKLFGDIGDKLVTKATQARQSDAVPDNRCEVPRLLCTALHDIPVHSIHKAFRVTGVYPLSRGAIPSDGPVEDTASLPNLQAPVPSTHTTTHRAPPQPTLEDNVRGKSGELTETETIANSTRCYTFGLQPMAHPTPVDLSRVQSDTDTDQPSICVPPKTDYSSQSKLNRWQQETDKLCDGETKVLRMEDKSRLGQKERLHQKIAQLTRQRDLHAQ